MSGRRVFAEIQHLVEVDELHPDDIHLPGVFVDDVLLASASSPKQPTIAGFGHD
jgi:3-oxoacid CoA-transferase subunit A